MRAQADLAPAPRGDEAKPTGVTPADPDDPIVLLFTSGTTGLPKGALLPVRQLFGNAVHTTTAFRLTGDDRTLLYTPLFHTGAINVLAMPLLQVGGRVDLHPAFDAAAVLQTVHEGRVTALFGVPTTFQMLLEHPAAADTDWSALRVCLCGGAPLPVALIEAYQARGLRLTQGFGMTEVGPNCFFLPPDQALPRAGSVGLPMPWAEARVVADGREAAPDEVGELWLKGPHVCLDYFRNPTATAAALDPEGWFHTGDLVRRDADGFFFVAGRKKDMFISGGENIYPAEVEVALAAHPDVAECAVVEMPDARWGEVGCAFAASRGAALDEATVRAWLRARLAGYKVPKRVIAVDALPRNASGKVLKDRLRARAREPRRTTWPA